jgi:peptidoglycan/xylan/chitin deacetylase (PgdA/CDA1 family)
MTCILLYHRIANDGWRYSVSPDHFREQLDVLNSETDVITLREAVRESATCHSRLRVVITFDDGYADNVTYGWPLLSAHDMPATFFVISGSVGSTHEFWWDELEWLVSHGGGLTNAASYDDLHARLRRQGARIQRELLDALASSLHVPAYARPEKLPMSLTQLEHLSREGLAEIGGHSVRHPFFPALSLAEQETEIRGSKRELEEMTGRPVCSFSYPYGIYTRDTMRLVEQAGYARACKVGNVPLGQDHFFALPRLTPKDWNGEQFARHLREYRDQP